MNDIQQENTPTLAPEVEAAQIARQFRSRNPAEQAAAQRAFAQIKTETLLSLLEQEERRRKRKIRIVYTFYRVYGGILALTLLSYVFDGLSNGSWSHFPWPLFRVFAWVGGLTSVAAGSTLHKNAASLLAMQRDVRVVGPLAEALSLGDKKIRTDVVCALIELLPRMQAGDDALLNDDQRACLYRELRSNDTGLILTILEACEQVGDSKAIPFVEKLAAGEGVAAKDRQIREAAQACLPFLQMQAERERAARTLLRAATAPGDPATVLLRPAQGATEVEASLLLRPSAPETVTDSVTIHHSST